MYCSNCGMKIEPGTNRCSACNHKIRKPVRKVLGFVLIVLFMFLAGIAASTISFSQIYTKPASFHLMKESGVATKDFLMEDASPVVQSGEENLSSSSLDVAEIIRTAQPKVFTILTAYSQGTGFLIDDQGHVVTNAHVVEGDLTPIVRTMDGAEYVGELVGYSNTTDVAVIRIAELEGMEPLNLEKEATTEIGDEVIALGSPRGYENTATLGNISGVDRTFVIPPFEYTGIYQISAPIAPGSSGGPLLSKETGKVIAINSARDSLEVNIGFSIPIHRVMPFIDEWINRPMLEEEIYAMFYYDDGLFYFNDYLNEFGYFDDGGYYNENYDEYYEIPFDENWYDDWTEDWYWEEWEADWDDEYDEFDDFDSYWGWDEEYDDEYDYDYDEFWEDDWEWEE